MERERERDPFAKHFNDLIKLLSHTFNFAKQIIFSIAYFLFLNYVIHMHIRKVDYDVHESIEKYVTEFKLCAYSMKIKH